MLTVTHLTEHSPAVDLIAQGPQPGNRWRRHLPAGRTVVLGRGGAAFSVDWDDRISRQHAELTYRDGRLHVARMAAARNPIFVLGEEAEAFDLRPGEHFVIGSTVFTLAEQRLDVTAASAQPLHEQTFSAQYLRQLRFRNARSRIEVLGRLPEVISGASDDAELLVRLASLLMAGVPTADTVALVCVEGSDPQAAIRVLHWDRRGADGPAVQPSERLIREAIARGESILHLWGGRDSRFTATENVDWAFCTPVPGEACRGWGIYVAGRFEGAAGSSPAEAADLRDDLKFTEVAAATLSSLQELRVLQRRTAGLSQFFSPVVLEALADQDPEIALAPREAEVTVMFCDLRGFSRESEKSAGDLFGLLDRVSKALGVTTHYILAQGGVVGDFQGDAVMGFWGWPLSQPDAIVRAASAALAIRSELEAAAGRRGDPLAGFRLGIGIATGKAVAGRIGTADHVTVTVFGPVVNLAARLEGMTRSLRVPILLDEPTAAYVRKHIPAEAGRCRRLAVVKPFGVESAVQISELLPPESAYPLLNAEHLAEYEAAVAAFQAGDWNGAFRHLHRVPAEDRAKDFLTVLIAQHNRTPPDDWDGVIKLSSK